ncbi:MAG: transporter substrate-binding domain-containing protein [Synergistaceae bacterium]|nr:transporter substrate-binding domain-containing protein [Synergistaceae bacterium]
MRIFNRMTRVLILLFLFFSFTSTSEAFSSTSFTSYRDIPGVTDEEIEAIAALRGTREKFIFGMMPSTEAFRDTNGEIRGYTALLCEWLTELFGVIEIPFVPELYTWGGLLKGLESGEVDFTGSLTANDERRKIYYMTDPIAERMIYCFHIAGGPSISEIAASRPPRYAFLEGSTTINEVVSGLDDAPYELIFVRGLGSAYNVLKRGEADIFFAESTAAVVFDAYDDVASKHFFPPRFSPVSMSTRNPELAPVISVVQKALQSGAVGHLAELYAQGEIEYLRHSLFTRLTGEERDYIRDNPVISYVTQFNNYPMSFFNEKEKQWQGIAFDLLSEIEKLTGLTFQLAHGDELIRWPFLLAMVESGEAAFVTELIRTEERRGRFIWLDTTLATEYLTLASISERRGVRLNEVKNLTVGVVRNTAQTQAFQRWFPHHGKTVEYDDTRDAFEAMRRGDVDLVMTSTGNMLVMMNYLELTGYKANIVFDDSIQGSTFGFNVNETILRSIIDKALGLIDTRAITDEWKNRSFDYRYKLIEAQRPWLIGASGLLLCVLVLLFTLLQRKRHEGRVLEDLVNKRTAELSEQLELTIKLQQNLEAAMEAATAASRSKSVFLANMSHEIRTPMNAIMGITEILLNDDSVAPNTREALDKVYSSGELLLCIINDILDLSKIEAGKLELTWGEYDVASLINDVTTVNMVRIGSKPIEFELSVDENTPSTLYGDELRIRQILNNLLSNAFKYTESGVVRLSVYVEDTTLVLRVSDTGCGMTEEQLTTLFDAYTRFNVEANRMTEGAGLGMNITQNLVRLMGGEITVKSEPDIGTIFVVRLPSARGEQTKQTKISSGVLGGETVERLRKFRTNGAKQIRRARISFEPMPHGSVLVVDDVESNIYVVQGLLAPYKLSVDSVMSGFEAIDKIKSGKVYDVIFMDHMMPKLDGIETTKLIRAHGYTNPIVALTANALTGQSEIFLSNGFDAFISKPIDVRELNAALKRFVRG